MADICLIFEVHQPLRLNRRFHLDLIRRGRVAKEELFDLYFDNGMNRDILNRVAEKCYLPANEIILEEIDRRKRGSRRFKVAYSISGVLLEQCEMWRPDILESFRQIVDSGCVEVLNQTYYHSLASLYAPDWSEFIEQVEMHRRTVKSILGEEPKTFENTECIYNNEIAKTVEELGYEAIVTEGLPRVLGWRSPNYIYKAKGSSIKVLMRNHRLSDDIGFRFTSTEWDQWPLTADKYASWLASTPGQVITIFLDYETFGEHYWRESGILDFLRWLPSEVEKHSNLRWCTPLEAVNRYNPMDEVDVPKNATISWADEERDLSAWLGNELQKVSFNTLKEVGLPVKHLGDTTFLRLWRHLQTSDHLYYMSTKKGGSGVVHETFNPYGDPVKAFSTFITVLSDLIARCHLELEKPRFRFRRLLRKVPHGMGFRFFQGFARPTGLTANSLEEFYHILRSVDSKSISFHLGRGDFERWLSQVIGDEKLTKLFASLPKTAEDVEPLRDEMLRILKERIEELKRKDAEVTEKRG